MFILSQNKEKLYNLSGHIEGIGYEETKEYTKGKKEDKIRHTLMNNRYSNEITVVFLTSKPKKNLETHVTVYSTGRESVALCEGLTTLDKQRAGKFLGRMSRKEMDAIDKALGVAIGIDRKEEGGDMMVDKRASPEDWKEEAIRETAKAETYKAMYETLLDKIIQGGQTDV